MKRGLALILGVGLLSSGSAEAVSTHRVTARGAEGWAFQDLTARLSLNIPYRRDMIPPVEIAGQRARLHPSSLRGVNNPGRFNLSRYVRGENGGFQFAYFFE